MVSWSLGKVADWAGKLARKLAGKIDQKSWPTCGLWGVPLMGQHLVNIDRKNQLICGQQNVPQMSQHLVNSDRKIGPPVVNIDRKKTADTWSTVARNGPTGGLCGPEKIDPSVAYVKSGDL
jgi:hypothetical protein